MARRAGRRFYQRDPQTVAAALLGQRLVRITDQGQRLAAVIVETEAYLGADDQAAHSANGRRTDRNASMYRNGGHAYVYFTYGMHHCMNVVCDKVDMPTACLIRAAEPVEGIDAMRRNRAGKIPADRLKPTDLCSGPAKLCQAMNIDRSLDGEDLTTSPRLFVERTQPIAASRTVRAPRIGVDYAGDWAARPLRFLIDGHAHVSVKPRGG